MIGKLLTMALLAATEMGQASPPSGMSDPHIQTIRYEPDRVVTLQAAVGYAVVMELSEDERVENVVVGNSAGWQVTVNKRGDHLVIKPLAGAAPTNLVVTTDARRYVLLLQPFASGESAPFVVRFDYPTPTVTERSAAAAVTTYKLQGNKSLFPSSISDDGKRTTISWGDGPVPAIFSSDAPGKEEIVNGRMVDGNYVIEGVAERFTFRLGKSHATARRQSEAAR